MRRENLSKEEKRRIIADDAREEKELRGYVVQALAVEIGKLLPSRPASGGEAQKIPSQREGATSWQQATGEEGSTSGTPDRLPREGH